MHKDLNRISCSLKQISLPAGLVDAMSSEIALLHLRSAVFLATQNSSVVSGIPFTIRFMFGIV